jgi:hypothetical protein
MNTLHDQETEMLLAIDRRELFFPTGETAEIAATWHHWLAYDELQFFYGWSETELLRLVALERVATGRDLTACFRTVIAYAYADCRHELAELVGADVSLPLLPSGYAPDSSDDDA